MSSRRGLSDDDDDNEGPLEVWQYTRTITMNQSKTRKRHIDALLENTGVTKKYTQALRTYAMGPPRLPNMITETDVRTRSTAELVDLVLECANSGNRNAIFGVHIDQLLTPFLVGVVSRRFHLLSERLHPGFTHDSRALVAFRIVFTQYRLLMESQERRPRHPPLPPVLY